MHFTVIAPPAVLDKLALIWIEADNRDEVRRAGDRIDQILRGSPVEQGEDHGDYFTLTIEPLTVTYTVSPNDCLVMIKDFSHQA